ncbi:MAG: hypothetical protein BWY46_01938 [Firmicutes bacterium ADurb.Bin300]|nr:MAG: hypothetical protein BWY46_01938 [Firmicutes bacterium ADurb.Bin300]
MAGFLVLTFLEKFILKLKTSKILISFAAAVIIYVVFLFFKGLTSLLTLYISTVWYIFFWSMAAFLVIQNYSKKTVFGFLTVNLIILLISTVVATGVLREYPFASRDLAGAADIYTINNLKSLGAAGYGYIYGSVFLVFGMLRILLFNKNRWRIIKAVIIICVLTTIFLVFKASYSIAIFAMLFFILFALLTFRKKSPVTVPLVLFFFILFLFRIQVLNAFISFGEYFEIEAFTMHAKELLEAITYETYEEDIIRVQIWRKALMEFAAHPIVGGSWNGGHSFILQHMALFGMFSSVVFVFISYVFKIWSKFIDKQDMTITVIAFIFITLFNSYAAGESSAMIFMMLPMMLYCKSDFSFFDSRKNKEAIKI